MLDIQYGVLKFAKQSEIIALLRVQKHNQFVVLIKLNIHTLHIHTQHTQTIDVSNYHTNKHTLWGFPIFCC